jgi:hypothetical protein
MALEGLALVVSGLGVLVAVIRSSGDFALFLALVVLFLLYGGVLLLAARGVLRRRRWSRSRSWTPAAGC